MYTMLTSQILKMLRNLAIWLDKAEAYASARKFDASVLLRSRLYPDMLPLSRQVQIVTDNAKAIPARLSGRVAPVIEDKETTLEELRQRIRTVSEYVAGFTEEDFKQAPGTPVSLPFAPGKYLPGEEYLVQMGLPNFYFHLSVAYSILRHNGVELGKADFIGGLPYRELEGA